MHRVVVVSLVATSMLVTSCWYDKSAGDVLAIVHGLGAQTSTPFDLDDGPVHIDERGGPAGCVQAVKIVDSSGQVLTTLRGVGVDSGTTGSATGEDSDWVAAVDVDAVKGTYQAQVTAPAKCAWAVRVTVGGD